MNNGYRDLIVWQKSMDLVDEIYNLVKFLPKEEIYALSDQMRRAVVSIPSNIAEGYERNSKKEYIQFLSVARSSRAEIETQLYICIRQKYLTQKQAEKSFSLCQEIAKILNALINKEKNCLLPTDY
ncbi:MAG: four helix bundle protein [Clostridia bacterium]|nr:four helix bundle protein [Clostridia bacterium]